MDHAYIQDQIERRRRMAVIDSNSLMHRAFHAIRQPMNAPDGTPTGALFGFFNMFLKLCDRFSPDVVLCAFDKGKPKIRTELYPAYKAKRPPTDPLLKAQFPVVRELLKTLGIPVVECEGWEGDDILGTLAKQGENEGMEVLLFTGDRDMYQLSSEYIKVVSTKKGLSEVAIMDPESVRDLYGGIGPELVTDFYGLKGDSSDNIPGVPGIGPKRAAELLLRFGSLDEVLSHASEIPGKMGENLSAHVDDALLSRKLATILCTAPVDIHLSSVRFPDFDTEEVRRAFSALGFGAITRRLVALMPEENRSSADMSSAENKETECPLNTATASDTNSAQGTPETSGKDASCHIHTGPKALSLLERLIKSNEWLGCAGETIATQGPLFEGDFVLWVSSDQELLRLVNRDASSALIQLFSTGRISAKDIKALLHIIVPRDSSREALIAFDTLDPERYFDVGLAAYLLDSDKQSYEPQELAERFGLEIVLPKVISPESEKLSEAALDAVRCRLLREPLLQALAEDDSDFILKDIELPLLAVLARMEREGLFCDSKILKEQSLELEKEIEDLEERIYTAAGHPFNINSPEQLSRVLFDELGLPSYGLKRTKKGFFSTGADVLKKLAPNSSIVQDITDFRERSKLKSTYLDALPALIADDGKIHTAFNQTVAATGRLSSSDPNLQNIPTRSALGHRIRRAFTVGEDEVFLACDYSQIELRLLAHLSGDEHLIAAFCAGADFHAATAARVFGLDPAEVTPELRRRAKAINFGIVYGQQAFGLAESLGIPQAEAKVLIDSYFLAYPGVRAFLDTTVTEAHRLGYAQTLFGRKRRIHEFFQQNRRLIAYGERTAMNHPMQGTAADIIKIAMIEVERRLEEAALTCRMILQVHDELDFVLPISELTQVSALVKETMEHVVELQVPLVVDLSFGSNWAEAK